MSASALGASQAIQYLPAGSMVDFAGTSAPAGWLMCDGRSLPTASYPDLFAALSYSYGGSGANFSLPDFRGRFARYNDNMGTAAGAAGRDSGRVLGTSQAQATKNPTTPFTVAATGNKNQFNTDQQAHSHGTGLTLIGATNSLLYTLPASGSAQYMPNERAAGKLSSNSGINTNSITFNDANFSTSGSVNGGGDAETRPINLSCNRIIKY
jgi:microcystin-dependent protein